MIKTCENKEAEAGSETERGQIGSSKKAMVILASSLIEYLPPELPSVNKQKWLSPRHPCSDTRCTAPGRVRPQASGSCSQGDWEGAGEQEATG